MMRQSTCHPARAVRDGRDWHPPCGRGRRGESLVAILVALTLFSGGVLAFLEVWIPIKHSLKQIQEKQTLARIIEHRMEDVRSVGALYLPNKPKTTDPIVRYYDALGREVPNAIQGGYTVQTWVTYLPNDAAFQDGTANTISMSSLREVTNRVIEPDGAVAAESTTFIAPGGFNDAF